MALTESWFHILKSLIAYNIGYSDSSALSALGTSKTLTNLIEETLINHNKAYSNSVSIMYSKVDILNCTFEDNYADTQSKNIFIGFSTVSIKNTLFENTLNVDDSYETRS